MSHRTVMYAPEYRDGVLDVQRHLWNPDVARNDRYFAWKYELNPFADGPPLVSLALDGGEVVAMHGAYASPCIGPSGREVRCMWTGDLVVAPEHRRRGFAKEAHFGLVEAARELGVALLVNASTGRLSRALYLNSGWTRVGRVFPHLSWGEEADLSGVDRRAESGDLPPGVTVSRGARPERMAALADGAAPGSFRIRKSAAFLEWRYSNPLCDYRFVYLASGAGEGLDGYAVLHAHGPEHDTGLNLVDWEASSPAARERLLDATLALCDGARLNVWPDGRGSSTADLFQAHGLAEAPPPEAPKVLPAVLARPLVDDEALAEAGVPREVLGDVGAWDMRMIASDYY